MYRLLATDYTDIGHLFCGLPVSIVLALACLICIFRAWRHRSRERLGIAIALCCLHTLTTLIAITMTTHRYGGEYSLLGIGFNRFSKLYLPIPGGISDSSGLAHRVAVAQTAAERMTGGLEYRGS